MSENNKLKSMAKYIGDLSTDESYGNKLMPVEGAEALKGLYYPKEMKNKFLKAPAQEGPDFKRIYRNSEES